MWITVGPRRFSAHDARRSFRMAGTLWASLTAGRDATATDVIGRQLVDRLASAASLLPPSMPSMPSMPSVIDRLTAVGNAIADTDAALDPALIAAVIDSFLAASAALRADGQLPARQTGTVHRLHAGGGGVPKPAVDTADVGFAGVVGDRQKHRVHHGHPIQALCLWSAEVIADLVAAGHPIFPGAAGENVTIAGLHWPDVRPGVRLHIGTVECEISAFAVPCAQNAPWFSDRDFRRIHHDVGALSRVYAIMLQPGRVTVGDDVVMEP